MSQPKVMIVAYQRDWIGVARLPEALRKAGFAVGVFCPEGAYLGQSRFVDRLWQHPEDAPSNARIPPLVEALRAWKPTLVFTGDDPALILLQGLANAATQQIPGDPLTRLLDRSLGPPEMRAALARKSALARREGLPVPPSWAGDSHEEALAFAARVGYPIVAKEDHTWSGQGVRVCRDETALRAHLTGRSLADLALQRHVSGEEASLSLVAREGRLLACYAFQVLRRAWEPHGPAALVRFLPHPAMEAIAASVVRDLAFTGFAGLDFLLEGDRPWLLEINPRPVPTSHLGWRLGRDLCAALAADLAGAPFPVEGPVPRCEVALFPQLWQLDPAAPQLRGPEHDVPWEDPPLVAAIMRSARRATPASPAPGSGTVPARKITAG